VRQSSVSAGQGTAGRDVTLLGPTISNACLEAASKREKKRIDGASQPLKVIRMSLFISRTIGKGEPAAFCLSPPKQRKLSVWKSRPRVTLVRPSRSCFKGPLANLETADPSANRQGRSRSDQTRWPVKAGLAGNWSWKSRWDRSGPQGPEFGALGIAPIEISQILVRSTVCPFDSSTSFPNAEICDGIHTRPVFQVLVLL